MDTVIDRLCETKGVKEIEKGWKGGRTKEGFLCLNVIWLAHMNVWLGESYLLKGLLLLVTKIWYCSMLLSWKGGKEMISMPCSPSFTLKENFEKDTLWNGLLKFIVDFYICVPDLVYDYVFEMKHFEIKSELSFVYIFLLLFVITIFCWNHTRFNDLIIKCQPR